MKEPNYEHEINQETQVKSLDNNSLCPKPRISPSSSKFRKFLLDSEQRWRYRATHVWQWRERDCIRISIHRQRREQQIGRIRGEKRHISQILMRRGRNLFRRYRWRRPITMLKYLSSFFLVLDCFFRPRETSEVLNQGPEIPSLGVDDFGRMGVNDHWVVMIRIPGFTEMGRWWFLNGFGVHFYPQWSRTRAIDCHSFLFLAVGFFWTHIGVSIHRTNKNETQENRGFAEKSKNWWVCRYKRKGLILEEEGVREELIRLWSKEEGSWHWRPLTNLLGFIKRPYVGELTRGSYGGS